MSWLPYPQNIPPNDPEGDYGAWIQSERVLFTNGETVDLGYLMTWKDDEYPPQWKYEGCDGYSFDGIVTHWMPLPELP